MPDPTNHAAIPAEPELWRPTEWSCFDDRKRWIDYARTLRAALDALTRELQAVKDQAKHDYDADTACRNLLSEELDEARATIAAQSARIATLEEALRVAKEAMDERRSYVNGGDPSGCWQEMKYGEAWDEEDTQVAAALAPKEAQG